MADEVRKWTRFEFAPAIERIISGARRAFVTEVEEICEGDLIHLRPTEPARDVWVRVTDRADRVLSIEVDDDRHRCTCPTVAEQYGRHVEGCPVG